MSYADSAHRVFANMLGTLDHLVRKAREGGLPNTLLSSRLADDMFPLELQFRVALNQVLLALNRVAGQSIPLEDTSYGSFAEIAARIAAVRTHVDRVAPSDWVDAAAPIDLTLPNAARFVMSAEEDINDWIMPNFYFHVTMAYALLRTLGLEIGKMDFVPHMKRHRVPVERTR